MFENERRAMYAASPYHLQVFLACMLDTAARSEALLNLHSGQVDWHMRLVTA